jgi:transcriptional regulator with XRE-family HTH domain
MTQNENHPKEFSQLGDLRLGRKLSSIRVRIGLTQAAIAAMVAVSRKHISKIEIGTTSPTVRVLQDYLQACGTDLAEFFDAPLPINQTRRQREYHIKLQALLQNDTTSPVIRKVLDAFITSMQSSLTAAIQPIREQVRPARTAQEGRKKR